MTVNQLEELKRDFQKNEGYQLPFRQYGFPDALSFLKSLKDTVIVQESVYGSVGLQPFVDINDTTTAHVAKLVQNQKDSSHAGSRTVRPYKRFQSRIPVTPKVVPAEVQKNLHSLISRFDSGINLRFLDNAYQKHFGMKLQFADYGFPTLEDLIRSCDKLVLRKFDDKTVVHVTSQQVAFCSTTLLDKFVEILQQHSEEISATDLIVMYEKLHGPLRIKNYGFASVAEFLQECSDVLHLKVHKGAYYISCKSQNAVVSQVEVNSVNTNKSIATYEKQVLPETSNDFRPVVVAKINSPNDFFLRFSEHEQDFENIERSIAQFYSKVEKRSEYSLLYARNNAAVSCRMESPSGQVIWHRGTVLFRRFEDVYVIMLVDIGDVLEFPLRDIFRLARRYCYTPPYAYHASLVGISEVSCCQPNVVKAMQSLCRPEHALYAIILGVAEGSRKLSVCLCNTSIDPDSDIHIQDELVARSLATCTTDANTRSQSSCAAKSRSRSASSVREETSSEENSHKLNSRSNDQSVQKSAINNVEAVNAVSTATEATAFPVVSNGNNNTAVKEERREFFSESTSPSSEEDIRATAYKHFFAASNRCTGKGETPLNDDGRQEKEASGDTKQVMSSDVDFKLDTVCYDGKRFVTDISLMRLLSDHVSKNVVAQFDKCGKSLTRWLQTCKGIAFSKAVRITPSNNASLWQNKLRWFRPSRSYGSPIQCEREHLIGTKFYGPVSYVLSRFYCIGVGESNVSEIFLISGQNAADVVNLACEDFTTCEDLVQFLRRRLS